MNESQEMGQEEAGAGQRLCQPGEPGKASVRKCPQSGGLSPVPLGRQSTAKQRPQCRGPGPGLGRDRGAPHPQGPPSTVEPSEQGPGGNGQGAPEPGMI